jgi:hypothetical protein
LGEELTTAESPSLAVKIINGDVLIKQGEIIRNYAVIYSQTNNTSMANCTFKNQEFADFDLNSTHYYYIRVLCPISSGPGLTMTNLNMTIRHGQPYLGNQRVNVPV